MNNLKAFRLSEGLSQDAMARRLGITLSMYEKVERGIAGASAAFMRRIKTAFPKANIDSIFFADKQQ